MAKLSPVFNDQTFDANGDPATGYKLFTYAAGSSTKQTTYTDSAGLVPQSNPIILNASGYPTAGPIWLTTGQNYKFVLASSADTDPPTSPLKTIDSVSGVNDSSSSNTQWVSSNVTPTYISATSFSLVGDQTSEFHIGRRLQFTVTAGTVYGTISAAVFGALTTVTVAMDSGNSLDAGLSAVNLSILRADKSALPKSAGMNFSRYVGVTASRAINAADIGAFLLASSASPVTLTLPLSSGYPDGCAVTLWNTPSSSAAVTFALTGGDSFNTLSGTFVVNPGEDVTFANIGGSWNPMLGSAKFKYSAEFASSLAASGRQRLPGGLILQWGSAVTSGTGQASFTLPIAFSTTIYSASATYFPGGPTPNICTLYSADFSLSSVSALVCTTAGAAVSGASVKFIVIGK